MLSNKRQMHDANDDAVLGCGGDDGGGENMTRSITSMPMSMNTPIHEFSLIEFNEGKGKDGDDAMVCIQPNANGGEGTSKCSPGYGARAWYVDTSPHQFSRIWVKSYQEARFRHDFRMGPNTFNMICMMLASTIAKEDTVLRVAIPVHKRIAVCIRRLATGEPFSVISNQFGIGISTCHKIVLEVCAAICTVLMPRFLGWHDKATTFNAASGIPKIIGAMYTTHIAIIAPKSSPNHHYNPNLTRRNKKPSYSITLQGVVGPDGTFTDVCIGWPGSMLDDEILEKSDLPQRAESGVMDGSWVIGGSNYPLTDWLLVPYTDQNLTLTQQTFNEKVEELRAVAVGAFTRLKRRWGFLRHRTEMKIEDLPHVISACCVLHNICEVTGEEMDPELLYDLVDDETVPENPVRSETASMARDKIARDLLGCYLAGTIV